MDTSVGVSNDRAGVYVMLCLLLSSCCLVSRVVSSDQLFVNVIKSLSQKMLYFLRTTVRTSL